MKIGIAGAGTAGTYLTCRLSSKHKVELFDKKEKDELGHDCAWLFHYSDLKYYCEKCKLNPTDYLDHVGSLFNFFGVPVKIKDLITFNKHKFLVDMLKKVKAIHFDSQISRNDFDDFDLIIDATGSSRKILPTTRYETKPVSFISCYQIEVESHDLSNDFYVHPAGIGFLWVFPRSKQLARVGCGSFTANPKTEVEDYLADKNYKLLKICSGTIRLVPPSMSKPFFLASEPKIVGAGECIGTVSPLTGEGIRSTLRCADLLLETLKNLNPYQQKVLEEFKQIDQEFAFLEALRNHQLKALWLLFKISKPFGLKITKADAIKMLFRKNHMKNLQETISGLQF